MLGHAGVGRRGGWNWPTFTDGFQRVTRRVVLGEAARDDRRSTAALNWLRSAANWSYQRR